MQYYPQVLVNVRASQQVKERPAGETVQCRS